MGIKSGSRQILIQGMLMVFFGLLWGLVIPHTPHPRLALTAHVQFETNGVLYIVQALLLLTLPHAVGRKSILVMVAAVWLTWLMLAAEIVNAWWGTTQILPIAAGQAGVTGGTPMQEHLVLLPHIVTGLVLIVAWLLIVGFVRTPQSNSDGVAAVSHVESA